MAYPGEQCIGFSKTFPKRFLSSFDTKICRIFEKKIKNDEIIYQIKFLQIYMIDCYAAHVSCQTQLKKYYYWSL